MATPHQTPLPGAQDRPVQGPLARTSGGSWGQCRIQGLYLITLKPPTSSFWPCTQLPSGKRSIETPTVSLTLSHPSKWKMQNHSLLIARPSGISHLPQGLHNRSSLYVSDFTVSFPPSFASLIKAWMSGRSKRTQMHIGIWQRVFQRTVYTIGTTFRELAFKVE